MYKRLTALLLALAVVFSVFTISAGSAEAVSKHCKKHSFSVRHVWDRDMPTGGSAGRVMAKDGSNPNYKLIATFRGCAKADGFRVWKIKEKAVFPKGTEPCKLGFQGLFADFTWTPGGSTRHLVEDCEGRVTKDSASVNVFIDELIAPPQPGLERTFWDTVHIKAAWRSISDHERTWSDWIKY